MTTPPAQLFTRQLAAFAAVKLALHVVVNATTQFGFQRDEFLYFAMGRHLRLWQMDFPPGIALAANAVRFTLGDSMTAIRMVPALAGTAVLVLAVLMTSRLGGGRMAQAFTALAFTTSPLFLRTSSLFQPVVLDQLTWTCALYCLLRLGDEDRPRWWLLLGTALGLGLLVKFSMLIFGFALLLALLATPHRAALRTRWPWVAAAIAFAVGSPSFAGQIALHYPVITQMGQLRASQLEHVSYASFVGGQLLWGPSAWLGLVACAALVTRPRFKAQRLAGWTCVFAELVVMLAHGKSYYIGPVFPLLIAAAGVLLEASSDAARVPRATIVGAGWIAVTALLGAFTLPIALPILTPSATAAYIHGAHLDITRRNNQGALEVLPQDFADMLGWEEQANAMARAWRALTPAQRAEAVIGASNYGRAGALDYYGPTLGLPPAISTAGSYWFFGPGDRPGNVALVIEDTDRNLKRVWAEVRPVAHLHSSWSVREEQETNIFLCLRPRQPLQQLWPSFAH